MIDTNNKITSFCVDHRGMQPGVYFQEAVRNGTAVLTADVRFFEPNNGRYLTTCEAHTVEHILATLLRNSKWTSNIIYFGPMGCRTGFYLLTTGMSRKEVIDLLEVCCKQIDSIDEVPGARLEECGNYQDLNLDDAKAVIRDFLPYINETQYKFL